MFSFLSFNEDIRGGGGRVEVELKTKCGRPPFLIFQGHQ